MVCACMCECVCVCVCVKVYVCVCASAPIRVSNSEGKCVINLARDSEPSCRGRFGPFAGCCYIHGGTGSVARDKLRRRAHHLVLAKRAIHICLLGNSEVWGGGKRGENDNDTFVRK